MLDGRHPGRVPAAAMGDRIDLRRFLCGTLPDGDALRVTLANVYHVDGDRIVAIESHVTADDQQILRRAFEAGELRPDLMPGETAR